MFYLQNNCCSDFKADNPLYAKKKSKVLDVNAIFGVACIHDWIYCFMDMPAGEK